MVLEKGTIPSVKDINFRVCQQGITVCVDGTVSLPEELCPVRFINHRL